jgi:methionyl aminopeptidase
MAIQLKSTKDIAQMREAGRIVADTFARIEPHVKPGVTLSELDRVATEYLLSQGATTLYKGYKGSAGDHPPFPGVICASLNHEICHGLPDGRVLREGDIVGVDIGLKYKGMCGDACVTYAVGTVTPKTRVLLDVTQECLRRGITAAQPGARLGDIGAAIQTYAEAHGFNVVREWSGHGIGRVLHEPLSVPHFGQAGHGMMLRPGMTFTIEPMINAGTFEWVILDDGWTVITADRALSAQFEHTIAITPNGPEILTLP